MCVHHIHAEVHQGPLDWSYRWLLAGDQVSVPLQEQVFSTATSPLQPQGLLIYWRGEDTSQDAHVEVRGQAEGIHPFYHESPGH